MTKCIRSTSYAVSQHGMNCKGINQFLRDVEGAKEPQVEANRVLRFGVCLLKIDASDVGF